MQEGLQEKSRMKQLRSIHNSGVFFLVISAYVVSFVTNITSGSRRSATSNTSNTAGSTGSSTEGTSSKASVSTPTVSVGISLNWALPIFDNNRSGYNYNYNQVNAGANCFDQHMLVTAYNKIFYLRSGMPSYSVPGKAAPGKPPPPDLVIPAAVDYGQKVVGGFTTEHVNGYFNTMIVSAGADIPAAPLPAYPTAVSFMRSKTGIMPQGKLQYVYDYPTIIYAAQTALGRVLLDTHVPEAHISFWGTRLPMLGLTCGQGPSLSKIVTDFALTTSVSRASLTGVQARFGTIQNFLYLAYGIFTCLELMDESFTPKPLSALARDIPYAALVGLTPDAMVNVLNDQTQNTLSFFDVNVTVASFIIPQAMAVLNSTAAQYFDGVTPSVGFTMAGTPSSGFSFTQTPPQVTYYLPVHMMDPGRSQDEPLNAFYSEVKALQSDYDALYSSVGW